MEQGEERKNLRLHWPGAPPGSPVPSWFQGSALASGKCRGGETQDRMRVTKEGSVGEGRALSASLKAGMSLLLCFPLAQDRVPLPDRLCAAMSSRRPRAEESPTPSTGHSLVPPGRPRQLPQALATLPMKAPGPSMKMGEVLPGRLSHLLQIVPLWENQ